MHFHFSFCFFSWYFNRNYELCNRIKNGAITAEIKKYKAITKKIKKKHDNIVLFTKSKLDTIGVLICKALLDSVIIHDKFVSINNVLKEDNEIK